MKGGHRDLVVETGVDPVTVVLGGCAAGGHRDLVVETGVDPVTSRFSGARSAN